MHTNDLAIQRLATEIARDILRQVPGWAVRSESWLGTVEMLMHRAAEEVPPGPGRDNVRRANDVTLGLLRRFLLALDRRDVDELLEMAELWPDTLPRDADGLPRVAPPWGATPRQRVH